jgi:hypothetical protein
MSGRIGLVAVAVSLFLATAALASGWQTLPLVQGATPDNTVNEVQRVARMAIDQSIDYWQAHKTIHAAPAEQPAAPAGNLWFRNPTPFVEYGFADSRDRRAGGQASHINNGTAGLTFQTIFDVTTGFMYDYANIEGHDEFLRSGTDANTVTFFFAKNWSLLYVGTSLTFGEAQTYTEIAGVRSACDTDTFAVAPYIGVAGYQKGPLSMFSTLTCVFRHADIDFSRNVRSDETNDSTLVLMNRVSYNVTERFNVTGIFDWNQILAQQQVRGPEAEIDHAWLTMGLKVRYKITDKIDAYTGYTADVGNQSFENHRVHVGVSIGF